MEEVITGYFKQDFFTKFCYIVCVLPLERVRHLASERGGLTFYFQINEGDNVQDIVY